MRLPLRAILFDMDGTLLDTAPDMAGALNALRAEEGFAPMPFETLRCSVSHGAARVVNTGFPAATAEKSAALQRRFLEIYRGALSGGTRLFPGMDQVLEALAEPRPEVRESSPTRRDGSPNRCSNSWDFAPASTAW